MAHQGASSQRAAAGEALRLGRIAGEQHARGARAPPAPQARPQTDPRTVRGVGYALRVQPRRGAESPEPRVKHSRAAATLPAGGRAAGVAGGPLVSIRFARHEVEQAISTPGWSASRAGVQVTLAMRAGRDAALLPASPASTTSGETDDARSGDRQCGRATDPPLLADREGVSLPYRPEDGRASSTSPSPATLARLPVLRRRLAGGLGRRPLSAEELALDVTRLGRSAALAGDAAASCSGDGSTPAPAVAAAASA